MGSSASKGGDNDELVDNLLKDQYLKTPSIQQIFRAVDRGLYFTEENRKLAYDDTAWRSGNIHLSAPGIYCDVLENLELGEGMSFLNLGSGTGYLNTMAGLIIGSYGINYGVEVHKEVIKYAYNRLEKFKWTAEAIDEYDFCEPKFFEGNCLQLSSENRLFDRVYCGAACPPSYENYMKNLIKIDGILVMPLEEVLVKVKRTSETTWEKKTITAVNFANMILPSPCDANKPQVLLSNPEPNSLQAICRSSIRQILRKIIREENPELKNHRIRKGLRISSHRNGSDDPRELLEREPSFRMFLLHKPNSLRLSWSPSEHDEDEENEDEDDDDDDSSVANCRKDKQSTEDRDEDMEKKTDEEEDLESDEDEETERKVVRDDDPAESSSPVLRYQGRLKRKKSRQTSTSDSDSSTDLEDMDVDCGQSSSIEDGKPVKKTENGGKSAGNKGRLRINSKSPSKSEPGESSDGAGCSSNNNLGSFAESDDGEDDKYSIGRRACLQLIKYQDQCEMLDLLGSLKKESESPRSSSDTELSDDKNEENSLEPPTVSPAYSVLMRRKIHALPLPPTILSYLNFHRTF